MACLVECPNLGVMATGTASIAVPQGGAVTDSGREIAAWAINAPAGPRRAP